MLYAETCINEIDARIKNFANAAMTSKKLRINEALSIFPDYYFINFRPATQTITFEYEGKSQLGTYETWVYQTIKLNECRKEKIELDFATGTDIGILKMNSGFRQIKPDELFTFSFMSGGVSGERFFVAEIPINVCLDLHCSKEFFKRIIDTRAQAIFTRKCHFYSTEDTFKCETREDEQKN